MEQNSSERRGQSRTGVAYDDAVATLDPDDLLRALVGDATDGIVATDASGTVTFANAGVDDALGYAPADLVGAPATKLFAESEDDPETLVRRFASESGRVERRGRHRDGSSVPLSVSFREHESDGTTLFVGVLRNDSERKRTDDRLRRRGEAIERLQRLDALVRGATRGLVRAESKAEIDRVVADHLVETELFEFATVGTVDASDWSVTPAASAGGENDHESEASRRLADVTGRSDAVGSSDAAENSDEEPGTVERAVRTGETQVVADASADLSGEWREAALASGYGSVAVVPLGTDAARSGVAVAYRETSGDLTRRERAVLDDLGEVVGYAVRATERAAALGSDAVVQLKFGIPEFGEAASSVVAADDWEFRLERTVRTGDRVLQYGTVTNARPEPFVAALESLSQVEKSRHVASYDDEHLLEVRYANTPLLSSLAEYGGRIRRATATAGSCRIVVEVPSTLDVRSVVQTVQGEYPNATLVAQRTTDRETTTYADIEAAFADRLTDRQQTAIEVAHLAGYFEWPRESSAEDVADSLGIGPSTFTQHLRAAERKLFAALLDGESAD